MKVDIILKATEIPTVIAHDFIVRSPGVFGQSREEKGQGQNLAKAQTTAFV